MCVYIYIYCEVRLFFKFVKWQCLKENEYIHFNLFAHTRLRNIHEHGIELIGGSVHIL